MKNRLKSRLKFQKPVVEEPSKPEESIETEPEQPEETPILQDDEPVQDQLEIAEDSKQQSSAEATPKKSKGSKKRNKMKIEEVETVTEEAPEVIEAVVEVKKPAKKKQKQPQPKDELMIQPKNSLEDLLQLVIKTPLDDLEIQNVIDLLLTKQTGSSNSNNYHDWIDASDNKQNETKNLQRQLAEKEQELADEMAKCKNFNDKLIEMR